MDGHAEGSRLPMYAGRDAGTTCAWMSIPQQCFELFICMAAVSSGMLYPTTQ